MANWTADSVHGPMPDWLRGPLEAALADLQQPTPVDIRAGFESSTQRLWLSEGGERSESGFTFDRAQSEFQLLREIADCLQEYFFPETRGAWGEARPECPGHPHPAQANEVADEAWWVCPVDGRQIARIGHLRGDD